MTRNTDAERRLVLMAAEFGYRANERGLNLEGTLREAGALFGEPEKAEQRVSFGYTWPITESDRKPVNSFKTGAAAILRHMAKQESNRRTVIVRGVVETRISQATEKAYLDAATLLDNIIIEGE